MSGISEQKLDAWEAAAKDRDEMHPRHDAEWERCRICVLEEAVLSLLAALRERETVTLERVRAHIRRRQAEEAQR